MEKIGLHGNQRYSALWQKIVATGIEVDQANIELIEELLPPPDVKEVKSFVGHVSCYRRFIQDFSKIAKPSIIYLSKKTRFTKMKNAFKLSNS